MLDGKRNKGGRMAGSIICGVDDSASARGAARVARVLVGELGLALVFVRVVERDAPDAKVGAIAERLERLSAGASDVDCGAAWLVEAGHPADRLVDVATRAGAAMIVVGSTGPRSSLLGSISAEVSRRAPCPAVVVPPGGDAHFNGHLVEREHASDDSDLAGRIARFGLGGGASGEGDVPYDLLMRWEEEGGASSPEGLTAEDDAERADDDGRDKDGDAVSRRLIRRRSRLRRRPAWRALRAASVDRRAWNAVGLGDDVGRRSEGGRRRRSAGRRCCGRRHGPPSRRG
jgi:nucleotide-binding universal stress UspA family protein